MSNQTIKKYLKSNLLSYLTLISSLALTEIGTVILIVLIGEFIDSHYTEQLFQFSHLINDVIVILILLITVLLTRFIHKRMDFKLSNKGLIYFESIMLEHLMHVELEEIIHQNKIELAQQINNDSVVITDFYLAQLPNYIIKLLKLITIFIIVFTKSFVAAISIFLMVLVYELFYVLSKSHYKKLNLKMLESQQKYFGVLGGELLNVFLVKANSWYEKTVSQFESVGKNFVGHSLKFLNFDFLLSNLLNLFSQVIVLLLPIILLLTDSISISVVFVLITLFQIFFSDFSIIIELLKSKARKEVSSRRLDLLFAMPCDLDGNDLINDIDRITVDSLNFAYRNKKTYTINNLACNFLKGEITVIIGENGAGKSTLVKLLLGIFKPSSGEIRFNNILLSSLDMVEIRKKKIAFCEQEPYLLSDTIINNLNYSLDNPKSQNFYQTNPLLDFVELLDDGFDTVISSGSQNLSGGQKQKIALARTLAKEDAEVFIFDEPNSALDSESIRMLLDLLNHLKKNKIVIIVTHDQSILQNADSLLQLPTLNK